MTIQKITSDIKAPNNDLVNLKNHFPQYFDKNGNFDFEKFKNYLTENEVSFSTESYGLEWLGKSYARLLASDPATTLLKADEEWNNKPENAKSENLLIKGDNLEVLKHLANAYYEKVKMIYIDPPYNTGSDGFVYNDDRKYTVKELQNLLGIDEERAKRILSFTQSKSNSHSAWLTFMYPRLYIAKQLLRDDGVIFVSIDDNEVAQLRLLMDEIFGEENFVQQIIWQKKKGGSQDSQDLAKEHEYILIYKKSNWQIVDETLDFEEKEFNKSINGRKAKLLKLEKWGNHSLRSDRPSLYYSIKDPNGLDFYPIAPNGKDGCWRKKPENLDKSHIFWQKDSKNRLIPYEVIYFDEMKDRQKIIKTRTIFTEFGTTTDAVREVLNLFNNNKVFETPKPVGILKKILKLTTQNDEIILDFFAGSGTTGDAVMQLNAEDGGNRKYILVQLPEPIDPKKNQTAYDFVKSLKFPSLRGGKAEGFDGVENISLRGGKAGGFDGVENISLRGGKAGGFDGVETSPPWQQKSLFPFWTLPKNKTLESRAKELRKQGILSEVVFWKTFKEKEKIKGYDIDRQVIIGNYIVDFFIAELGLVVEIDGNSHDDRQEYNAEREKFLKSLNLMVIRYTDENVLNNIQSVYDDFLRKIIEREKELLEKKNNPPRPSDTPQEGNWEPTIFEITKERLIRAAKKIKTENIDKKIAENEKEIKDLQSKLEVENNKERIKELKAEIEALKNQDLDFKIFETMPIWEDYDFEAEEFDSSQTLFDTGKLSEDDIKALLTTWKTYDGIPLTQDLETIDLSGYITYYGSGRLYLMHKGFTTDNLKALLEKIDTDKHFEPKIIIAFGYHFESARLRELAENVKNYANKKHTDIDFIIRY